MIVCICNAIREREIRDVARTGITDVEEIYGRLGCEPNCCQCLPFAAEIALDEVSAPA
ncbi:MAG TPA: (2Fe-2S)-binding protein [Novosphingobium sp.]|nr:(2Fe-2S)-binding protein [Novosphingobium sp.]